MRSLVVALLLSTVPALAQDVAPVDSYGLAPLAFGMTEAEARAAIATIASDVAVSFESTEVRTLSWRRAGDDVHAWFEGGVLAGTRVSRTYAGRGEGLARLAALRERMDSPGEMQLREGANAGNDVLHVQWRTPRGALLVIVRTRGIGQPTTYEEMRRPR